MGKRDELIELVRGRSFLKSEKPAFKLASGKMSNVYFDLRLTTLSPEGQYLIGELLFQKLKDMGWSRMRQAGLPWVQTR